MPNPKPKRARVPRPVRLPPTLLRIEQTVTGFVPVWHQKLVGRVVIEWAKLEALMKDFIRILLQLDIDDARIVLGPMEVSRLIQILRDLGARYLLPKDAERLVTSLEHIDQRRVERNDIVHGSWGMVDGTPVSASLKSKSEIPEKIVVVHFPRETMHWIVNNIIEQRVVLDDLYDRYETPDTSPDKS